MRADRGRWALVRLSLECSVCEHTTVQREPAQATPCSACDRPIEVTDFPRIAAETGPPLDRLAWGATRSTTRLVIGRQQPLCWQCGEAVPLSAADIGTQRAIYCSGCDAQTDTQPAPEWLRMHLPDALQVYAASAAGTPAEHDTIWMRCAACEAGMRVDGETERLTRCGSCHAKNHVPDAVWQALHPVRHGAPWYVLFEQLTAPQRAERMQAKTALNEAISAVGQPNRHIPTIINRLRRDGSHAAEDALFAALETPAAAWFNAALAALSDKTTPRIEARLIEALDAEVDPVRQLAIACAIEPYSPDVTHTACVGLVDSAPSAIAAQALAIWTRLAPASGLTRALTLTGDAPLTVRRQATRLLIEHARVPFGVAAFALLDHLDVSVQRHAVRLVTAANTRTATAALRGMLVAGQGDAVSAALHQVGGLHAQSALQVARKADGRHRVTATLWAAAAGAIPDLVQLVDDLNHQEGDAARAVCDALLAESPSARSQALCALLEGPTLKIRLDAAELLETQGEPEALGSLDALAGRWFTNRGLKQAAEKAANAIRWRVSQSERGGLTVHDVGGLTEVESPAPGSDS